ncbi:hypothetical protein FLA105534_04545 [Flavobacterium bizetiae]|uniref:Uncharacterized protein n=1 Tax=Flavobacterium bizetiae TaxID=2704140 RepID=A0A6J4GWN1_9FLAO|nr:hypothetical protein FLA105534_04545 [Flavobacterium bizetiae]
MKIKIPTIKAAKINIQHAAARCLGNFNLPCKKVKIGTNKTANKKAIKTGVIMSFPAQKIKAKEIKLTNIKASLA